ncbi:MAG TPA: flavin prenyltransferase UbiX [Pirellulaceae bacterium]|nr:flavin prenyltransferase UbiX [Pirellulaceae bacterium]HMO92625.1 flavin prenyltransferase UbiX [Pirellulaceae bacterium]HMP70227.1 flavin prenyltransferase UbiX [Pirellulaceae bacterium]
MSLPIVVAITGASGVAYGRRLVEVLLELGHELHLVISPSGMQVLKHELRVEIDPQTFVLDQLLPQVCPKPGQLHFHHSMDYMSSIASGSYLTRGMVVVPCSGATLSSIAHGSSRNLVERAADVHLKERRPLILVPRETPLSLVHICNMRTVTEAGAIVLPASPGFYHGIESIDQMIDFIVARVLDQLKVEHSLSGRWGKP